MDIIVSFRFSFPLEDAASRLHTNADLRTCVQRGLVDSHSEKEALAVTNIC